MFGKTSMQIIKLTVVFTFNDSIKTFSCGIERDKIPSTISITRIEIMIGAPMLKAISNVLANSLTIPPIDSSVKVGYPRLTMSNDVIRPLIICLYNPLAKKTMIASQ